MRHEDPNAMTRDTSKQRPRVTTDPSGSEPDRVACQFYSDLLARGLTPQDIRRVGLALICLTGSAPRTR